jgi:two-component system, OmpR family, response regulator ResD
MRSPSASPIIEAMAGKEASLGSILVVDDEPTIAEVVARYLERAGYETRVAADGPSAVAAALGSRPDLIVLDIMLPGFDGLEVMRRIHEDLEGRIAVILLTAKGEESDRLLGLRRGADDYVVKPFSPAELVARVQAVMRRADPAEEADEPLRFDELVIEPAARVVTIGERQVELTQREFDLLLFLARHPGQVFSRDQLMDCVWRFSSYSDTTTVTVHIRRLRSKIEPDPARPRWIETVWGVGYRFQPGRR